MRQTILLLSLIAFCTANFLFQPPSFNQTKHQTLFILAPGAFVPPSAYVDIAKELQSRVSFQLWVGIVSFLGNTPNPLEFPSKCAELVGQVQAVTKLDGKADVFIAGHSLGGTIAQLSAGNHSGLILWGSYITNHKYASYNLRTFTLAAELDGLTRVTRIAEDFAVYEEQKLNDKPIIVLPGVTHSQYCNQSVKGDIKPEIPLKQAYGLITKATAAYLTATANDPTIPAQDRADANNYLQQSIQETRTLVSGFIKAQKLEKSQYCADSQSVVIERQVSSSDLHRLQVSNNPYDNLFPFVGSKPTIDGARISTDSHNSYNLNPIDISTIPVAANEIACKMKSLEAIVQALNTTVASKEPVTCLYVNQILYQAVSSFVTQAALKRYAQLGKQIQLVDDIAYTAGPTWVAAGLKFDIQQDKVQVASPALHTDLSAPFGLGGMQYCKLLSPAKLAEWIMVDSLKNE